jgi:hypothetical protein
MAIGDLAKALKVTVKEAIGLEQGKLRFRSYQSWQSAIDLVTVWSEMKRDTKSYRSAWGGPWMHRYPNSKKASSKKMRAG